MSVHENLCDKAKEAIDKVFSDISVEQVTTKISINDIIDHAKLLLDTLQE